MVADNNFLSPSLSLSLSIAISKSLANLYHEVVTILLGYHQYNHHIKHHGWW